MIVVCNLVYYQGFNGQVQKEHGTIIRKGVKIPVSMVEEYNQSHTTSQYEIDEQESKRYKKIVEAEEKKKTPIELNEKN